MLRGTVEYLRFLFGIGLPADGDGFGQRLWFGWPDPPEFVFFALQGRTIRAAKDFDRWPTAWTPPAPVSRS